MSQFPKVKGVADIVFLLDATGSMGPCINAVKQNIKTFVQTFTSPTPNGPAVVKDWRAKIVGYRDLDYTDFPAMVDNPFVSSVQELEGQLDALAAGGASSSLRPFARGRCIRYNAYHHTSHGPSSRPGTELTPATEPAVPAPRAG